MRKSPILIVTLAASIAVAMPPAARAQQAAAPAAPAAPPAPDAAKKEEPKKPEGGGEGGEAKKAPADISGGRFAGDPVYVHLSPMILPVITNTGAEQIVSLQITIQVSDFDAADTVHSNMPKVMDALMRALYGGLGNGDLRDGQLVDVSKVKSKAITALGQAIGASNIRDVLIEAVAQRRL
jgi:flagellar basal body-associated protein FliL